MILRQTLLYLPAGVLGPALQVVQLLVLTHWLTPAEVGLQALIVAVQDLLHLLALVWWSQYVLRYLESPDGARRAAQDRAESFLVLFAATFETVVSVALVAWLAAAQASPALIAAAALSTVGRSLVAHWSVRARAEQRVGLYALAQVAAPGASLLVMLALFAAWGPDLTRLFVSSALGHCAVAGVLWSALRLGAGVYPVDAGILRAAIRYGSYTLMGSVLAWISMQAVRFTNEALIGMAAVGQISVGWAIGQRIAQQLAAMVTTAVFPLAVEKARTESLSAGLAQLSLGGTLLLAVIVPATAGVAMLAQPLAALLTAETFREMTAIVLPLAVAAGAVRVVRHNYLDEMLQLAERPALMTRLDAIDALSTVLLCGFGAWQYGIVGSVVGCLIASTATTLYALVLVRVAVAFSLDWVALLKVLIGTAGMTAVITAIPDPRGIGALGATILVGMATYAASMAVMAYPAIKALLNRAH